MRVKGWEDGELGRLARLYTDREVGIEEIEAQLPGRTANAIRLKASRLGLRREELKMPRVSELNWLVHEKGDQLMIVAKNLSLSEAVRMVLEDEGLEATGWEDSIPQVTIRRARLID